jgi:predicted nucleic acid-binding protein
VIAADTTVVVAAFAPWHEHHDAARAALGRRPYLPDHCALEAYATLTRLPDPFRAPADIVVEFLDRRFGRRRLEPTATAVRGLPARLAALGIVGGSTYDALVAVTAAAHDARLKTLDRRAEVVYQALGVDYELVSAS